VRGQGGERCPHSRGGRGRGRGHTCHVPVAMAAVCPQWDAFTLPELHNFLRILQREEEEHVRRLRHRYARCRQKMQEALATRTPG